MRHIDLTHKNPDGIIDHADRSISPSRLQHPFTFQQFPYTPPEAPTLPTHFTNKQYTDDQAAPKQTHYVGIKPVPFHLTITWEWVRWPLIYDVPAGTRWVEIVHVNPSVDTYIIIGSRHRWAVINRWTGLWPLKQVTWTTGLNPALDLSVYTNPIPAVFYLVGYWT